MYDKSRYENTYLVNYYNKILNLNLAEKNYNNMVNITRSAGTTRSKCISTY